MDSMVAQAQSIIIEGLGAKGYQRKFQLTELKVIYEVWIITNGINLQKVAMMIFRSCS